MIKNKIVAIDFDGTITENSPYPITDKVRKYCRETIEFIRQNNNIVILWTCRCGKFLDEAIDFLNKNNIVVDFINCIDISNRDLSRKISADIYIDDRNIFCEEIDWLAIKKYFQEKTLD